MKEGGDEEMPAAAEGEEVKNEDEPLMEEEKKEEDDEEKKDEEEDGDGPDEEDIQLEKDMCCCCVCACQTEETKPHSCCGCFPIKCGLITIGIIYLLTVLALFVEVFYCLLNEYIHWWYVPVAVLCLVPLIVGAVFFIRFFTKDQESTRTKIISSMILAICSFSLLAIWNLCYFQWLYKFDVVYAGADVVGYTMQTKKAFMVWSLFIAIVLDFIWAYFLCVATTYSSALDGKPKEEEMDLLKVPELPKLW